jgi:hypothetical protein
VELALVEAILSTLLPFPYAFPLKSVLSLDPLPGGQSQQLDPPQHGLERPPR